MLVFLKKQLIILKNKFQILLDKYTTIKSYTAWTLTRMRLKKVDD